MDPFFRSSWYCSLFLILHNDSQRFYSLRFCGQTVCVPGGEAGVDSVESIENSKPACPGGLGQGKMPENADKSQPSSVRRRLLSTRQTKGPSWIDDLWERYVLSMMLILVQQHAQIARQDIQRVSQFKEVEFGDGRGRQVACTERGRSITRATVQ